jgi:hypothetical protein
MLKWARLGAFGVLASLLLAPGESFEHQTRLLYGVPHEATAALMNLTVVTPTGGGFLTVYPSGFNQPISSNVNFAPGQVVANSVLSSIGGNGRIVLVNGSGGTTDALVDLSGYFVPPSS